MGDGLKPQTRMICVCLGAVAASENCSMIEAFQKLVDYTALKLSVDTSVVVRLKQQTIDVLDKAFDMELLKQEHWDWFGEALISIDYLKADALPDVKNCDRILAYEEGQFPRVILFKSFTTGREVIKLHEKYGDNFIYYGIEKDLLLYKIALLNIHLYNIPAFIVQLSNEDAVGKDFTTSSSNWDYSNFWVPPKAKLFS